MRTFSVLIIFFCSLAALGSTLSARAHHRIRIEPAFFAPEPMESPLARGKKDGGRDDEESEEEYVRTSPEEQRRALDQLDPSVLDGIWRLQAAVKR